MDYAHKRARADQMIREHGQKCKLRRAGGAERECWALEAILNAFDRKALKNPKNRIFLITPVGLSEPPDEQDALLWQDADGPKVLRQDAPVYPLAPNGTTVIYYELQVQG